MLQPSKVPARRSVYKDGIACGLPATRTATCAVACARERKSSTSSLRSQRKIQGCCIRGLMLLAQASARNFACPLSHAWNPTVRHTRLPTSSCAGVVDSLVESCFKPSILSGRRPCLYTHFFAKRMLTVHVNVEAQNDRQSMQRHAGVHESRKYADSACALFRKKDLRIGKPDLLAERLHQLPNAR